MDIARSEQVETDLNRLIARRDAERRKVEGEHPTEELYRESTRRHEKRQELRRWWATLRFHEEQIRRHSATLEALVARHRLEVVRLEELLGIDDHREEAA